MQVELEDNALDVHEMSEELKQAHTHQFDRYYEEFATHYLRKRDDGKDAEETGETGETAEAAGTGEA